MRKTLLFILAIISIFMISCTAGKGVRATIKVERQRLKNDSARGAKICTAFELASAESHLDFAEVELNNGNLMKAESHILKERDFAEYVAKNADYCIPKDKDEDGIEDKDDKCPLIPGTPEAFGCPDRDGDTVADSEDQCPDEKGEPELKGCPAVNVNKDSDKDGIPDINDQCPFDAEDKDKFEDKDGCPDFDNDKDKILDVDDKCPNSAGPATNQGCPITDADKDGIPDEIDKCPALPEDKDGFEDNDGCPDSDNDKDTILDHEDDCPDIAGPLENRGCPVLDRDGDGILDAKDKCPDVAGVKEEEGCPKKYKLIVVTDKKIELKQTIFFATGKATIKSGSYSMLNEIADAVKNAPSIKKVVIEGHTDSTGSRRYNVKLSQKRADAVRKYLISKGVSASKLKAVGYGPDKPIASNRTRSGQAKNRRVEFNIEQ